MKSFLTAQIFIFTGIPVVYSLLFEANPYMDGFVETLAWYQYGIIGFFILFNLESSNAEIFNYVWVIGYQSLGISLFYWVNKNKPSIKKYVSIANIIICLWSTTLGAFVMWRASVH